MKRDKSERVTLILYLVKKLQNFPIDYDRTMNLYLSDFDAIHKLKKVFTEYINQDEKYAVSLSGRIKFEELNKVIEYTLPIKRTIEPSLIFRARL